MILKGYGCTVLESFVMQRKQADTDVKKAVNYFKKCPYQTETISDMTEIKTEPGFNNQWPWKNPRRMITCLPSEVFYFFGPNSLFPPPQWNRLLIDSLEKNK